VLLPENATGNFVKVVQRLPVRIDLEGCDPNENTLLNGTSVLPYVYLNKPPTGPDAGKFLQATGLSLQPSVHPRALLVLTNDERGSLALKSCGGAEPVAAEMGVRARGRTIRIFRFNRL
jgi:hypothetical protein